MKRIALRSLPDPHLPKDHPSHTIHYRDVVEQVIRAPLNPQGGVGIDEMRQSIRVLDALDKADGTLQLEDADWNHLVAKTKAMQWAFADRRILTFIDDVLEGNAP